MPKLSSKMLKLVKDNFPNLVSVPDDNFSYEYKEKATYMLVTVRHNNAKTWIKTLTSKR